MASNFSLPLVLRAWPNGAAAPRYPYLHGGEWLKSDADSPDPLRGYRWGERLADDPLAPLQCYAILPVESVCEAGVVDGLAALSAPDSAVEIQGPCRLRFDFGVESAGWLEFESDDLCGEVELSISEYNRPGVVNLGAQHPEKTAAPVRDGTTWRLELNDLWYEGVRFGWLHVRSCPHPWSLRNLRLVCQTKPVNYRGSFQSSDAVLNRIWETGAYGVKLNLNEDHFGSILMERSDRHSWTGDAYVSQAVAMAAFGNFGMVRENLIRMEEDDNGIEAYSLHWILAALDYAWRSGDCAYVFDKEELVARKLERAFEVIRGRLPLNFFGHDDRTGACFEEPNVDRNRRTFACFAARVARMSQAFFAGRPTADAAEALLEAATADFGAVLASGCELHAGSEAILASAFANEDEQMRFVEREFMDPVRAWSYSPFNGYTVLQAMARAGSFEAAVALLHRGWGAMLRLGATTFWESFRPEWEHFMQPNDPPPNGMHGYTSLCHPWSGGPTAWLTDHLLGVEPLEPGFTKVRILPHRYLPGGFIRGTVPTPMGGIEVERNAEGLRLVLPEGIVGEGPAGQLLESGTHEIALHTSVATEPLRMVSRYACQWLVDRPGDSIVPDEADGWVAFCARPNGADFEQNLQGIRVSIPENRVLATPRREMFALALSRGREVCLPIRGALRTKVPEICGQNFTIDVGGDLSDVTEVGLVFKDNRDEGIEQTIDVLDLEGLHPVLPTRMIRDFASGLSLRFRPLGAFRIRICQCYGPDATISGLYFKRG